MSEPNCLFCGHEMERPVGHGGYYCRYCAGEDALCPVCRKKLIYGWWCLSCGQTKNEAASTKRFEDAMEARSWSDFWFLFLTAGFICFCAVAYHLSK